MGIEKMDFGTLKDGQTAALYRLTNSEGAYIEVTDYGAALVSVVVPDRDGKLTDVVLGYEDAAHYEKSPCHFGSVIGRNCNRIAGAVFVLNGQEYHLPVNENENNVHSGPDGYEFRMWDVTEVSEEDNAVTFTLHSPDGDQGFPGNFNISVKYGFSDRNELVIHYMGKCDQDTLANLTNHSYFNLDGHECVNCYDNYLRIDADGYYPVIDSKTIPTGELLSVAGTPMDFTSYKKIGQEIDADYDQLKKVRGYDHHYACNGYDADVERVVADAYSEKTGIAMILYTDRPGIQLYTGNYVDGEEGKGGVIYGKRSGFCLETQYVPDSVHQENVKKPILLKGEEYNSVTIFQFMTK